MGDHVEVIYCPAVPASQAVEVGDRVVAMLQTIGLVESEADPDATLGGGAGFRPGPRIAEHYLDEPNWIRLRTNGLEVHTSNYCNVMAINDCEWHQCPSCKVKTELWDEGIPRREYFEFTELLWDAIEDYSASVIAGNITCPNCDEPSGVNTWTLSSSLGLSHLAFEFWNWPAFPARTSQHWSEPLDRDWVTNVVQLIATEIDGPVGQTGYKV